MNAEEKRQAALNRMTPEEREIAEQKRKQRAEKKQNVPPQNPKTRHKMMSVIDEIEAQLKKSNELKELEYQISLVRFGKEKSRPELLDIMDRLCLTSDYNVFRDRYVGIIHNAFCIRTVQITDPVKNKAADFLDLIMSELKIVELGVILGLLTEGYVSKSLARILIKHAQLIIDAGYGEFVLRFVREIRDRKGNLNEDGTISPFTTAQQKRVDELYDRYKSSVAQKSLEEWHNS